MKKCNTLMEKHEDVLLSLNKCQHVVSMGIENIGYSFLAQKHNITFFIPFCYLENLLQL